MTKEELLSYIDHTLLKPVSTWEQIQKICEEGAEHHTASVCIPPAFVKRAADAYGDRVKICTVIGFPLGYNTTDVKVYETKKAIEEGADEVDMVVNLGDVKEGAFDKVTEEIKALREASKGKVLKVIIETCFLTEEEKIALCKCVTEAGADHIKTSTGFGTAGATIEDIELFKKYIGPDVKIKAAGGIRTLDDLHRFAQAGCDRIGSSAAVELLSG